MFSCEIVSGLLAGEPQFDIRTGDFCRACGARFGTPLPHLVHRARGVKALSQGPVNALVEGDPGLAPSDPDLADLANAIDLLRMNLCGVELLIHIFDFRLKFDRFAGFDLG